MHATVTANCTLAYDVPYEAVSKLRVPTFGAFTNGCRLGGSLIPAKRRVGSALEPGACLRHSNNLHLSVTSTHQGNPAMIASIT